MPASPVSREHRPQKAPEAYTTQGHAARKPAYISSEIPASLAGADQVRLRHERSRLSTAAMKPTTSMSSHGCSITPQTRCPAARCREPARLTRFASGNGVRYPPWTGRTSAPSASPGALGVLRMNAAGDIAIVDPHQHTGCRSGELGETTGITGLHMGATRPDSDTVGDVRSNAEDHFWPPRPLSCHRPRRPENVAVVAARQAHAVTAAQRLDPRVDEVHRRRVPRNRRRGMAG